MSFLEAARAAGCPHVVFVSVFGVNSRLSLPRFWWRVIAASLDTLLFMSAGHTVVRLGKASSPTTSLATRYDKLAARYEAAIHIVAINEWL